MLDEYSLSQHPQRIDIVLLLRERTPELRYGPLRSLKSRLGAHSLVELKGPTHNLAGPDILLLLGYGLQYMAQEDIEDPDQVHLFTLSDHVTRPFRGQTERLGGRFLSEEPGVWRVEGLPLRLYCIEAGTAGQRPGEYLLYPFSEEYLRDPRKVLPLLQDEQERELFFHMCREVEQLRKKLDPLMYEDYEMFESTSKELLRDIVLNLPDELMYEVLGRIPPAERLKGLGPEEFKKLTPEERARLRALLDQSER